MLKVSENLMCLYYSNMGIIVYDEWEQCSHSGEIQYLSESERRPVLFSLGEIVPSFLLL